MSYSNADTFSKENLNYYLNELSKEYRKLGGKNYPAEIVLIGGAAILANYGFRETTTDIDAILPSISIMKEAINHITDKHHLPEGWLNNDFVNTKSYSPKLAQYSLPYKDFNHVLSVRIVMPEYLIAMKLKSGRKYKNDLSDIVGILEEQSAKGNPLSLTVIKKAYIDLYGSWNNLTTYARRFIESIVNRDDYRRMYDQTRENEKAAKSDLDQFEAEYPNVLNEKNIDKIIEDFKSSHREEPDEIII